MSDIEKEGRQQLARQLAGDIAFSLELKKPPAALTAGQIDACGYRTQASLESDRRLGGGIPYIKAKGKILYPLHSLISWLIENQRTSTAQDSMSPARRKSCLANINKAQAMRHATRAGA